MVNWISGRDSREMKMMMVIMPMSLLFFLLGPVNIVARIA